MRVFLDARARDGEFGGVQQVIIGLASGFSKLTDADDEYRFLAYSDADEWLRPHVSGPAQITHYSAAPKQDTAAHQSRRWLKKRVPFLHDLWRRVPALPGLRAADPPPSNGFIEQAGADVMHFTTQGGFITKVPTVYQPHDLQHIHLPQFFSAREKWARHRWYKILADQAAMVAVVFSWVRQDMIRHLHLPEDKVRVIEYAPVLTAYRAPAEADHDAVRRKFELPHPFVLYPAQTWPHKNHMKLLEALALLRERHGLTVPLICTGTKTQFHLKLEKRIRQLGLTGQVRFLGFVSSSELQCLYSLARAVTIPTLFEAGSAPMWEAFTAGTPVACSNVTSLPAQAGDAALVFDPHDAGQIAESIRRLWTDDSLRQTLIARGRASISRFSWERTARIFRAHYRRISGRALTDQDREMVSAQPLL